MVQTWRLWGLVMRSGILGSMHFFMLLLVLNVAFQAGATGLNPPTDTEFKTWLEQLWPEAERAGVSRATFDLAIGDLDLDLTIPDLIIPGRRDVSGGQPEFVKPPSEYLSESALSRLAKAGTKRMAQYNQLLLDIEREFGVPPSIIVAVWGREFDYGNDQDSHNAIRVLATEAYLGRRKDMFRHELLLALKMVNDGFITIPEMRSSWAGAMGPTQFLPSDFYRFAVDFDGDGRKNIWTSIPDALASAAKQLVDYGWQRGRHWGYEVRSGQEPDCTFAAPDFRLPVEHWAKLGLSPVSNSGFPKEALSEDASLLMPAGTFGPKFLTLNNFNAIRLYNSSDLYALFVGHLSDRIDGGKPFATPWMNLPPLDVRSVEEVQRHLIAAGYYYDEVDGRPGSRTRSALGLYQRASGLKVDCWPKASDLQYM